MFYQTSYDGTEVASTANYPSLLLVTKQTHESQSNATAEKHVYPYLLDEGMAVSSPAFLFEGLPGAGADLLEIAESLPCEARYSAVGEAE